MTDVSLQELARQGSRVVANRGTFWQKFTCGSCGSRQTMERPNAIFQAGTCEECGETTDLRGRGGGLVVLQPLNGSPS